MEDYNSGRIPRWVGFSNGLFVNSFVSDKGTTLTGTPAPGQSGPGSNDNYGVSPHSPSPTNETSSVDLV